MNSQPGLFDEGPDRVPEHCLTEAQKLIRGRLLRDSKARARTHDPSTSHQAARGVHQSHSERVRKKIRELLRFYGPMTDPEILERLEASGLLVSESGARTRRAEQVPDFIKDTGNRRVNKFGNMMTVWGLNK